MLKKFITLMALLLLTGCGTIVKTEIKEVPVYRIETVYVTVPSHLLKLNTIPTPPKRQVYLNATETERAGLVVLYSQSLISELRMCNADKKAITKIMKEKVQAGEERDKMKQESK